MMKLKLLLITLMLLAAMPTGQKIFAQSKPQPTSYVESSPNSDIRVDEKLIAACNAATDELATLRRLTNALETENVLLKNRLNTELKKAELLTEINDLHKRESLALREALAARSEAIGSLQKAIEAHEKTIKLLEKRKRSLMGRITDILIGVALIKVIR